MATPLTTPEVGGMGHSIKRKEDPRFIRGRGHYVDDIQRALYGRFSSRGEAEFQDRVLSAMRFEFGGHVEKASGS